MSDFIHSQGPAFLAHLLRRLADELIRGAEAWYPEMGVQAPPRTISTLLLLSQEGPLRVTAIASRLRQSHPLVIVWLKQLDELGLTCADSDPEDGRRTLISLSRKGKREVKRIREVLVTMEAASLRLLDAAGPDALEGLWRMEVACREQSFVELLRSCSPSAGPD